MQPGDQLRAVRLLATTVVYIGYPEYLDKMRGVEYEFEVGRNYFQNLMSIVRSRNKQKLDTYVMPFHVSRNQWPRMPLAVSSSI